MLLNLPLKETVVTHQREYFYDFLLLVPFVKPPLNKYIY